MQVDEIAADRPRWQLWLASVVMVVLATAVTGYITGSYPAALLATGSGLFIFWLLLSAVRERDIEDRREILDWLVDLRRPTARDLALVALVFIAGIASRLTLGTLGNILSPDRGPAAHSSATAAPEAGMIYLLGLFAYAVVLGPTLEELVFRNGLQKLLTVRTGLWPAVLFTSLLFAVFHIPSYGGIGAPVASLAVPMGVVFVDSVLYGLAYHRTGNVVVAILAHGLANAVALATVVL